MILQDIWFFLWGLLWAVYFITDGFDLGIGCLLPVLAKTDEEKRIMFNSMGPLWDGNEVWLLTAGGVTFAAFPKVYGVMFSSLYSALMLLLFSLILRGVCFEFRSKVNHPGWRRLWDTCMFAGSLLPAILLGVAFANIFRGIPFDGNGVYQGTLITLLNPYGLLGGLLFLMLFLVHGAIFLSIKSDGDLHTRAARTAGIIWWLLLVVAVIFLIASALYTPLYKNYLANPMLFIVIVITVLALLGIKVFVTKGHFWKAWFSSALTIIGATFYGVIGLYPNMFPSSIDPAYSLSAHNASSSPLTLKIMLVVAVIFVPIVLSYQIWAYNLFKHKVTKDDLAYEEAY
ncbi:Cytochrome bd quinol oxidase subunit II [uncultured Desulfobacterium sp.]|uniref:Cytochrome bd quinol oxidase subunit II n=1 Tax=uncultured Desulfobacterium sp. TaxID=201089 RepID=A0A445N2F1_9BACT|nr:Cytochrome bd quinol oxidase subunit II [uncultured Desulfobacterium sp.]